MSSCQIVGGSAYTAFTQEMSNTAIHRFAVQVNVISQKEFYSLAPMIAYGHNQRCLEQFVAFFVQHCGPLNVAATVHCLVNNIGSHSFVLHRGRVVKWCCSFECDFNRHTFRGGICTLVIWV